jgi:hypothetical protein
MRSNLGYWDRNCKWGGDEFVRHSAFSSINFNNKDTICMRDVRTLPEERN